MHVFRSSLMLGTTSFTNTLSNTAARTVTAKTGRWMGFQEYSLLSMSRSKQITLSAFAGTRLFSRSSNHYLVQEITLSDDACPQGIQGDDCDETFNTWMNNCRRYGLANCDEQLQGIQSGRKTLGQVLKEQDDLIAEIAAQYRSAQMKRRASAQGVQDDISAFPTIDSPCPQGIQGDDCARFKLWLENCHRFGMQECMAQYVHFKAGRKTLAEIFDEQDRAIREAVRTFQHQQRRRYSTSSTPQPENRHTQKTPPHLKTGDTQPRVSAKSDKGAENVTDSESPQSEPVVEGQLTQRQRLQRAVKEYGSTVIVFHVTISLMSLGFFYVLVSSGIDVVAILQKLGIGETILQSKLAAGTGTFVVAYAVHKVFAPVRIATTLTATPFIVRYLRRIGFLKTPVTKSS